MSLSPAEQDIWDKFVSEYDSSPDAVEQASQDPRVVRVSRYLIEGEYVRDEDCDYQLICEQIGGEYGLEPEEVMEALAMAEEGIELG